MRKKYFTISVFLLISLCSFGQNIVSELAGAPGDIPLPELATENIKRISKSGRIFILTNNEQSYYKGDFISIILDNKLTARALVAKNTNQVGGVKILKIYSMELWNQLAEGKQVKILRGDDSYFKIREKKAEEGIAETPKDIIQDEDDLYNETALLEDDQSFEDEDDKKRVIKPDNVVSLFLGFISSEDKDGASATYTQMSGSWAYQVEDNIWVEASYGLNTVNDFPTTGLDTKLSNYVFRAKYAFSAPFYSIFMPYVGFQIISADSPGAGLDDGSTSQAARELELTKVEGLEKKTVVGGVTVLKRLVPGWFVRANVGTDLLAFGFALEF